MDEVVRSVRDPEALFYATQQHAYLGERERALRALAEAVRRGYFGLWPAQRHEWFDAIRADATFEQLVDESRKGYDDARAAFQAAGGDTII
jgi:hypothetical protein